MSKVDTMDSKLTSLRMIKNGIQKGWNFWIHFCFVDEDVLFLVDGFKTHCHLKYGQKGHFVLGNGS